MKRKKNILLLAGFLIILLLPWHQQAYSCDFVEITNVYTTDFAGNAKTIFHPGDNVRYNATFNVHVPPQTKVIARGMAKGPKVKPGGREGLFKTELEKQRQELNSGHYTFSWDESIPVSALAGQVSYRIKVRINDGEKDVKTGLLTVEEAPSKIVFVREELSEESGFVVNKDLWIMNPDGSEQTRLTFDPAVDRSPAISPDGMKVAFASDRAGNLDIWIMDLETGTLTQLTDHSADDLQPEWSPDGKKIAFTSNRAGSKDVWLTDVDFGGLQPLTVSNFQERVHDWSWSPKNKRLLFVSDKFGNDDIWKMKPNGREKEQLTYEIDDQKAPRFSPATNEIAFTWWPFAKPRADIYVMNKNGNNLRRLTPGKYYDRAPAWSPNGGRIGFFSNRAGNYDIWTMKHDGTEATQITTDPNYEAALVWRKAGFSDEYIADHVVPGQGKRNIAYIGTVHLAEGGALKVEMSWDDTADLDLGVLEPNGTLVNWKNFEGAGRHQGNVIPGPGTEVYTLSGAPQGDYLIGAYYKNFETTAHWRIRWRDGSFEPTPAEAHKVRATSQLPLAHILKHRARRGPKDFALLNLFSHGRLRAWQHRL